MTIQLLETCEDERGAFLLVADHIAALLNGDEEVSFTQVLLILRSGSRYFTPRPGEDGVGAY